LGLQRAAHFSWQKTADAILDVFREVAHQSQPAVLPASAAWRTDEPAASRRGRTDDRFSSSVFSASVKASHFGEA